MDKLACAERTFLYIGTVEELTEEIKGQIESASKSVGAITT